MRHGGDDAAVVVWDGTPRHAGGYLLVQPERPHPRPEPDDPRELVNAPPRRRGRPARAGTKAVHRVELRLTLPELHALQRLARLNRQTVADTIRLAALDVAADGPLPDMLHGRELLNYSR